MEFRVSDLQSAQCARLMTSLVVPRPIAWVVSQSAAGRRNAAPFSFFNAMCSWPPVLAIGVQSRADGSLKDTTANIIETREFTVNLVDYASAPMMNASSSEVAPQVDELEMLALETRTSTYIEPPRIAIAPASFECVLRQHIPLEEGCAIILANVSAIHVTDAAIVDTSGPYVNGDQLDLVGRMHGRGQYLRAKSAFSLDRPAPSRLRKGH